MGYSASFSGKTVDVRLTAAALRALSRLDVPLVVEMELYFSCLIRKRVNFNKALSRPDGILVTDSLYLCFRPVMTKHCAIDSSGDAPSLTEFPVKNAAPFVPKWVNIDYRRGQWRGEFGY